MKISVMSHFSIHFRRYSMALLLTGCTFGMMPRTVAQTGDHAAHDEHSDHHADEERVVRLDAETLEEFGIRLASVGPGELREVVELPGDIRFNRKMFANVTPRYAGTIEAVNVGLGAEVKKGQVLATLESNETLRPFEVRAPFDGTVVSYDVALGESVAAGTALFGVADLSTVWADLRIYRQNLGRIEKGQPVVIKGIDGLRSVTGTIDYLAPTIDEHTRTGLARVIIDNADRHWKPGLFIKGIVAIHSHAAPLVVPLTAILSMEGEDVVFVRTEEGFEPREVTVGHRGAASVAIEAGLEPGDVIVVENAISLKAELGKSDFGGHHH